MKKLLYIIIFLLLIISIGCSQGRNPIPIATKTNLDIHLSCSDIFLEYSKNTKNASLKIEQNKIDDNIDIIIGIILLWPGFADLKNADGIEGNALLDRNIYLQKLSKQMNCNILSLPLQPDRYK